MLKRIINFITLIAVLFSCCGAVVADSTVDTYVYLRVEGQTVSNDKSVKKTDIGFMSPLRQIADKKGANITWFDELKTAEVSYNNHKSMIAVGKDFIYFDNEVVSISQATELLNGVLYVSEDVVKTVFELQAYYDAELSILDFVKENAQEQVTVSAEDDEYEKNKISVVAFEDTYTAGGTNAEKNYGNLDYMCTRHLPNNLPYFHHSYVKFDISGLSLDKLNSVIFEGFISSAESGSTTIEKWLYDIDPDSWKEDTLTYNNRPTEIGELVGVAAGRSKKMIGVPITDYVKKKIAEGETVISFMMEGEKTNIQVSRLATREHATEAYRPKLVFDYNDPEDYKIFDDYPTPEYGKGIHPLDNAKEMLRTSTATYDYGRSNDTAITAEESVQVIKNDNASYSGEKTMSVLFKDFRSNNINSYLKFDLSDLEAKTVGGAYIKLYCTSASVTTGKRRVLLREIGDDSWQENTLTWLNAPEGGKVIAAGDISAAKTWLKIDLTDYINEKLASGDTVLSFMLDAYDNYTTKFASHYDTSYAPQLVIVGEGEEAGSQRPVFKDYSSLYDQTVSAMNPSTKKYADYKTRLLSSIKDFNPVTEVKLSKYGGDLDKKYDEGTGFFRVEKIGGRWWFIDPEGYLMYSYGKCNVRPGDSLDAYKEAYAPYGGRVGWTEAQIDYYDGLNYNSFGGWAFLSRQMNEEQTKFVEGLNYRQDVFDSEKMKPVGAIFPHGVAIQYARPMGGVQGSGVESFKGGVIPVFNPDFEERCSELVKNFVTPWKDNPYIMGWWSDNEINESSVMLDSALALNPQDEFFTYTHAAAWEWLRERTGKRNASLYDVNDTLREEFREFVFDRYYQVMSKAFKTHAPNHLYLGTRHFQFAETSPGIFRAAERYCDVISINLYRHWTPDIVDTWAGYADAPILITEWYARPEANVNLNALAGGFVCKTSEECGKFYQHFALRLLEAKNVVGFHFFTAVIGEEQENYMREFNPNVYNLIDYFDK